MSLKRRNSYSLGGPYKKALINYAGRKLYSAAGGFMKKKLASAFKKTPTESVVTSQYDYRQQYKKKKRYVPRRAKVFRRRVKSVIFKELGSNQYIFRAHRNPTWVAGRQSVSGITLLGLAGDRDTENNDLNDVFESGLITSSSISLSLRRAAQENSKLVITNHCIDFIFRNGQTTQTMDLDVYVLYCRKDVPRAATASGSVSGTLEAMWENIASNQRNAEGTALTSILPSSMGLTPFQLPQFCSYWTVASKKKFILGPGVTANYQYKSSRPKTVSGRDVTAESSDLSVLYAKKGVTVGFLFIVNNVTNGTTWPASDSGGFQWSAVKTMNAKLMVKQEDTLTLSSA